MSGGDVSSSLPLPPPLVTPRLELSNMCTTLLERAAGIVRAVAAGEGRQCVDEITAFGLQFGCDIAPAWMYGRPEARHLFVHSQSTSAEMNLYEQFCARLDACDASRFERPSTQFEFSANAERASFYTLRHLMLQETGRCTLLSDVNIESLYMPIYHGNHCSLLVYSVPRRVAFHLDSIRCRQHQDRAQRIVQMLVSAGLLQPFTFRLELPAARLQHEMWECGWCALLLARWWRSSDATVALGDAHNVALDGDAVAALAALLLERNIRNVGLDLFSQRLERSFGALGSHATASRHNAAPARSEQ